MVRFSGAGRSEVGWVREHNEDSGFIGQACLLVADGVGGAAAGEVASATVAYVVAASLLGHPGADPGEALEASVLAAQEQLRLGVRQAPGRVGMATTLTAVATDGRRIALVHVGDSRGYLFRAGRLRPITSDHTFVQRLIDDGTLDETSRRTHPWRNMVLRSLDGAAGEAGDVVLLDLVPGDRLLLASDGLTDLVEETRLAEVLAARADEEAVDVLVQDALDAGGSDNVTCVVATVVQGTPTTGDGSLIGAARDPRVVVDPAAVRLPRTA